MFVTKIEPRLSVPTTEGTVILINTISGQAVSVVIENLDQFNTLTYKFQRSDNGSTWVDVATFAELAPESRVSTDLPTGTWPFFRLRGSGNLNVAVRVDAQVTFSGDIDVDDDGRFTTKIVPEITIADTSDIFVTQFTLGGFATQLRRVTVENTGSSQLDGFKFQWSNDKVTWTDLAMSVVLAAGQSIKTNLQDHMFYRLQVDTDGTTVSVKVDSEITSARNAISTNQA